MRRAKNGHVLIEMVVTLVLVGLIVTAATALMSSSSRSMDRTSAQVDVDTWATIGIQHMMDDLREAKRVEIVSATDLLIYYPVRVSGVYDRTQEDTVNTIEYYRSDDSGNASTTGNSLWRKPAGTAGVAIMRRPITSTDADARARVVNLSFTSNNPSSVDITLQVSKGSIAGTATCNLTHRAIFLRNY
jgi:type II secretory pathway pseudopilin PulG